MSINPFDDFRALFSALPEKDNFSIALIQKKINELTFPNSALYRHETSDISSLGKMELILKLLASLRSYDNIAIKKPSIALFAGSQTIPGDINFIKNVVLNLQTGGAVVDELCQNFDIMLRIYDLALDYPTMDISKDVAMDERSCAATMAFGLEAIAGDIDLLGVCSVDVGRAPVSEAAISQILFGGKVESWLPQTKHIKYIQHIKSAIKMHQTQDSFELIQKLGTREISAITGAILAARMQNIPVIIEGYTALLCASLLKKIDPRAIDHCIIAQLPNIDCYKKLAVFTQLPILVNLNMDNDCGAGIAFAIAMVKSTVASFSKLHSFDRSNELSMQ